MELFVTGDGTLHYEQNLTGRRLSIVALSTDNWSILKNHIPKILAAIDSALLTGMAGSLPKPS